MIEEKNLSPQDTGKITAIPRQLNRLFLNPCFIVLVCLFVAACTPADCIRGSGKQVDLKREIKPFTAVEIKGAMKLVVQQDSLRELRIKADDNIQEHIKTRVKSGKLMIETDERVCESGPVTVFVNAPVFTGISGSGAVEIEGLNPINAGGFYLDLSGSSRVSLHLNAARMTTNASGSTEISLTGQAASHQLDFSGTGTLNAFDFVVSDYRIKTSGSSKLHINVLKNLEVNTSGASDIEYRGNPQHIENNQSGSGNLKKAG